MIIAKYKGTRVGIFSVDNLGVWRACRPVSPRVTTTKTTVCQTGATRLWSCATGRCVATSSGPTGSLLISFASAFRESHSVALRFGYDGQFPGCGGLACGRASEIRWFFANRDERGLEQPAA